MPISKEPKSFWQREISKKDYLVAGIKSVVMVVGIAMLFYSDVRMAIVLFPIGVGVYKKNISELLEKKRRQFEHQFQDALQSLQAQLNAGYSMENAVKEVQKEMKILYTNDAMIVKEFTYMVRQLNLNITAEQVWKDFAERVDLPQVDSFVTVFVQAKRSGGDSIVIIKNAIYYLRERAEIQRETETVIAAKKLEFYIMTAIPFGIIAYMRVSFPEFMNVLYGNLFGKCFMSVCLLIFFVAWKIGCRIVEIEV